MTASSSSDPSPLTSSGAERRPAAADIDVFGLTDPGRVRTENQDQFLVASLHKLLRVRQSSMPAVEITPHVSDTRGWLFLVADGVGGRPDGQAASGTAVRTIAHYVTHISELYRRLDPDPDGAFLAELEALVQRTHEVLRAEGEREYGGHGGATTLTMVATVWPYAYLVQVGDSRCYRLRKGELELMSKDQTVAQALVDSGALSLTEAHRSPFQGVLASALGGREATPMTRTADIRWDDVMLLCTDGLTKHVSDDEIAAELRRIHSAEATCRQLVGMALERGGTDNVTVVVGRLRSRAPAAAGA
jgi:PPM family protein phosphatase